MRPLPIAAFFTPIIAAPSGRGLVPVLMIVGMWAFIDMYRHRRSDIIQIFFSPLSLWGLVATGLTLLSASWAAVPAQSIKVGLSFAGLAIFGLIMLHQAKHQTQIENQSTRKSLIVGMSIALILLGIGTAYGLMYDQPLWGKDNQHPIGTLSHAQTIVAIFLVPCLWMLWQRGAKAKIYACVMAGATTILFLNLEHEASNLAILVAISGLLLVLIGGRIGFGMICIGIIATVISMPFVVESVLPATETLNTIDPKDGGWESEIHRFHMWRFVADAITNGPLGYGFGADASRNFPGAGEKIMWGIELMPLHPHNGALQVWLELGAIGIAVLAAALIIIYRSSKEMPKQDMAILAALLAAYLVPWLLSYGVWQSWWVALAWLTVAIGRGLIPPKKADMN